MNKGPDSRLIWRDRALRSEKALQERESEVNRLKAELFEARADLKSLAADYATRPRASADVEADLKMAQQEVSVLKRERDYWYHEARGGKP